MSKNGSNPTTPERPFASIATAEQIVAVMPDLIFEFSPDGRYIAMHAGGEDNLYCSVDKILGRHFRDVLPGPVVRELEPAFEKAAAGKVTTVSYLMPGFDRLKYFDCRLLPIESGHILALIRDMTDSWRDKTELEQSEERYRTLVNNIPGVVYRCHLDAEWTAIFVSPEIEQMLGFPADDFLTRRRSFAGISHPEDHEPVRRDVLQAVEQGRPYHVSYRIIDAEGQVRHVIERGQAIYAEFDDANYLDGIILDVTDIHRMRQRLLVNSKMAAVGNLAAGVAHEINNPLAIAMANVEYVSEELGTVADLVGDDPALEGALADVALAVDKIQGGIDRVRGIIDDLRAFTDAAEGRADRLDVRRLIQWTIHRADARTIAPGSIDVRLDDVPSIWASEVGVVQVLWNLMDNAIEAVADEAESDGAIRISLFEEDEQVCLEVTDDGPGMEPDVAARAFEPFFTTKPVGQGAGLGLFVCRGLVESMDGNIELHTAPGEGTRVRVCFPAFNPAGYGPPRDADDT